VSLASKRSTLRDSLIYEGSARHVKTPSCSKDGCGQTTGCEKTAGCSQSAACKSAIGRSQEAGCEKNINGCCNSEIEETSSRSKCGAGAHQGQPCCATVPDPISHHTKTNTGGLEVAVADIERALPGGLEHIVLCVEGLTCVGCENKLFKSLDILPQVHNVETSLVMSQAEFDLDLKATSVEDVVRSIERATGFKCERLSSNGQYLDITASGNTEQLIERAWSKGVLSTTLLDKQTIRIEYDPRVIGARDLLATIDDAAVQLAPQQPSPTLAAGNRHVRHTGLMTLFSAAMTIPVLILGWAPLPQHNIVYGSISLVLSTIVQGVVAGPFYPSAIKALIFTHVIEMDLLIVLSTSTAYIFSIVSFAFQVKGEPLSTGEFFETSTLLVTLIILGRFISALARQRAVESISMRSLQVNTALLVESKSPQATEIDARLLQYGDSFKVMPESRITTDGIVVSGHSEVDESMVTGEAQLLEKVPGSSVIAGSINGSGTLTVRLSRLPNDNTISEIATMVDKAKFSKPKVQDMAGRIAGYFVPVVVVLALVTFCIWIAVSKAVRNEVSSAAIVNSITYAIAVLIVSCPCAVGLAIPMVVVISGGVAAKHGVVFKSADMIEVARSVNHVVFDKTGTLTEGQMTVVEEEYLRSSKESTASLVLGMTADIKHPVSSAVSKHLQDNNVDSDAVDNVKTVPGKGVEGSWNDTIVRAGNCRWLAVEDQPLVKNFLAKGLTVFCVTKEEELIAIYGLEDRLRSDASSVVSELSRRGITVSLVSGDDHGAVQAVAAKLEVPASHIRSRCSPADKQQYIKDLTDAGSKTVLFCGDGTNDAVALAQANVGVHVNEGTDVAQSAADVVLMRPSLSGILTLIDLSRAAYRRIVFNFAWAFVYNLFAILLAAGAFVNARIPPQYAGLGEIVSVLPVILIALQLKWAKL
jgi:heavy metal translocating P-type ATPase